MDTMQIVVIIFMVIGFVLGFGVVTRAALKFLANKNASINALQVDLNKQVNNQWPNFFDALDEVEDFEPYWDNFVVPSESSIKVSRAHYHRLDKRSQYGGIKMKWSTIHGREFGSKRKFKIKRAESRAAKRSEKESWFAFNQSFEQKE